MVVINTIKSYLREHRRIVVPAFGCFIVKEPGTILFSELMSNDDGVLRNLLTEQGLSDIEAAALIDRLIFEIRHSLINEGRCQIEHFGQFTRATDGNIRFYTDRKAFAESIEQLPLPANKPITKQPQPQPTRQQSANGAEPHKRSGSAAKHRAKPQQKSGFGGFAIWFAIAVIIAALAAIAYGIYCEITIPDNLDAEMEAKRIEIVKESPNN